ncbi:PREDICTED: uncharacterized protein LOC109179532 [Ipomoea nil]|uniref:uncharacterized protein LOC109179532 n=1 Tax=Ipomoea nil TaxID=35883 RepID=UPI000900B2BF|nr:PREDICTED: uncharacterized protein LOC109179532 [Ipomoea nil]
MVGLKRCIVALLSVVYLTFHADAANNFCATAINKRLCEKMVKGAPNWNKAITKAITVAQRELAKASKSGNPNCQEAYKDTKDKLKESKVTAKHGNKDGDLNFQLSAALTSLEDCTNALKDLKEDASAATKLNHGVEQAIRICLAIDTSSGGPRKLLQWGRNALKQNR